MHIYRAPSLRSIRETPPYFTPAMFPTLEVVSAQVLGRNRFHAPDPLPLEVRSLSLYQATITAPPNPHRTADGSMPELLTLPDGRSGHPMSGMRLFASTAQCAGCHPAPQFTTDQDPQTRRQTHDVGTGVTLPLRVQYQDAAPYPVPVPGLVGVWDAFPLLHGGAGGYSVTADERVLATHPFALRRVFELGRASGRHGRMAELSSQDEDDLLAYLLTL